MYGEYSYSHSSEVSLQLQLQLHRFVLGTSQQTIDYLVEILDCLRTLTLRGPPVLRQGSMSCLLRVSKRLKGDTTPRDLAGVEDSIEFASGVGLSCADTSERVWSSSDFSILHELPKPIVVVAPGLYQNPSRSRDI